MHNGKFMHKIMKGMMSIKSKKLMVKYYHVMLAAVEDPKSFVKWKYNWSFLLSQTFQLKIWKISISFWTSRTANRSSIIPPISNPPTPTLTSNLKVLYRGPKDISSSIVAPLHYACSLAPSTQPQSSFKSHKNQKATKFTKKSNSLGRITNMQRMEFMGITRSSKHFKFVTTMTVSSSWEGKGWKECTRVTSQPFSSPSSTPNSGLFFMNRAPSSLIFLQNGRETY